MAWIIGESFDFVASANDFNSIWDTNSALQVLTTGRFGVGSAVTHGGGTGIDFIKSSGSNDATHHIVVAFKQIGAITGSTVGRYFLLLDGVTGQVCIGFRSDGAIVLTSGGPGGTVLATYTAAFVSNVWTAFEFEVTINNTTGAFHVRKDGVTSDSFVATGLNTRPGTNAWANKLQIGINANPGNGSHVIDDLLWFSTSGAAPNTWVGDIRSIQLMPTGDTTQKQFSGQFPASYSVSGTSGTFAFNATANTARWLPLVAPASGNISFLSANISSSVTGNVKMALYDNSGSGGGPGALLGVSSAVVNPTAGITPFPFSGAVAVVKNATYYVGILNDVTVVLLGTNGGLQTVYSLAATYTSGFPGTAVGFTSGGTQGFTQLGMTVTPANSALLGEAQQDADTSYVFDNVVGHNDLYDIADLATSPVSVVGVQTRALVRKSDAGVRAAQVQLKSGSTTVTSAALTLSTSYQQISRVDTVDPNTSAAWTGVAINALQVGPVVQA